MQQYFYFKIDEMADKWIMDFNIADLKNNKFNEC